MVFACSRNGTIPSDGTGRSKVYRDAVTSGFIARLEAMHFSDFYPPFLSFLRCSKVRKLSPVKDAGT